MSFFTVFAYNRHQRVCAIGIVCSGSKSCTWFTGDSVSTERYFCPPYAPRRCPGRQCADLFVLEMLPVFDTVNHVLGSDNFMLLLLHRSTRRLKKFNCDKTLFF